ncbi:MAG: sugar phosphate isomerase/epimerase family protein [Acidobacteriaceae bacterium]|jgi:sugar phosphate isomerase/epimerase
MQPGISTHVFFQHRLHPGLLDALAAAGAQTIEVFAARHHFDYSDAPAVRELAAWFRSNDVRAVLHQPIYISEGGRDFSSADAAQWSRHVAPNLDLIAAEKSRRIAAMDEVKRAIESAEQVPFTAIVLHLGLKDAAWDEPALERSLTAIEHLKAFAAPLGVRLLLQNLQNEVATPEHLLTILKTGHFDSVGVCLDVGHLHLAMPASDAPHDSGVAAAVELLGSRIAQGHLHDNHGTFAHVGALSNTVDNKDEHLWPGLGSIDWPAVSSALATLPAATPGILEVAGERDEPAESVTRKAEAAFRALANPQFAQLAQNM